MSAVSREMKRISFAIIYIRAWRSCSPYYMYTRITCMHVYMMCAGRCRVSATQRAIKLKFMNFDRYVCVCVCLAK